MHAFRQRCAVRVTYSGNRRPGQWYAHGRYIARESAVGGEVQMGFTADADGIDIAATLGQWQRADDERLFKIIVSPEFGERLDLKRLTHDLMTQMNRDMAAELEWVAVAHFNTEHPHVHIALRGVSRGKPFRIPPDYVRRGLREQAQALCTAQLGFRTRFDALEAERREVDQPRPTSLDRLILNAEHGGSTEDFEIAVNPLRRPYLAARLHFLEKMALAEPLDGRTWKVRRDVMAVLRSMKKATDRQKMLAAHAALVSDPRLPLQYTPARSIQHLEGRVIAHTLDESSGITHMILEGTDAKVHLIPHDEVIESARQRGRLQPNSFIRLRKRKIDDRLHADDLGDADQYLQSHHFREDMRRLGPDYLEGGWAGWLGRYQKAAQAVFSQRGRRSFRAAGRDR